MKYIKFTIQTSNKTLKKVIPCFHRIFFLNKKIDTLTKNIDNLVDIWGEDIFRADNSDKEFYKNYIKSRKLNAFELRKSIREIKSHGCIIRDVDKGIVDFYTESNGKSGYFCWKYGDSKIKNWHPEGSCVSKRLPSKSMENNFY